MKMTYDAYDMITIKDKLMSYSSARRKLDKGTKTRRKTKVDKQQKHWKVVIQLSWLIKRIGNGINRNNMHQGHVYEVQRSTNATQHLCGTHNSGNFLALSHVNYIYRSKS